MAELAAVERLAASARDIPARTQLLAVAWLRWRIFVNSIFRRRPTGTRQAVGLAFAILLRLIVWPFLALTVIGPIAGSGFFAWMAVAENHPQTLLPLLTGIALLWQFVAINGLSVAATVSNFDPSSLARFPLRFGRYLVLRTLIGLLTPSTIVGCLALLAAAVGIGLASLKLALPAVVVLAVYALMNIFLTRMIGAWMERWLANRRFREIFGVLMGLVAIGFQFLNFQRAPVHAPGAANSRLLNFLHESSPYLHWLPPGFAANAILRAAHPVEALTQFVGLLASTAVFAAIFAIRLHKQFLGEHLSESVSRGAPAGAFARGRALAKATGAIAMDAPLQPGRPAFPPIVAACLRKEWLNLRGNVAQLVGMLTPLIFIVILNRAVFARHSTYFLPGAIAYALMGILAGLYNIFGADGLGVQVYLLAPIRLRDVILAKNLMSLAMIVVQAALAWAVVTALARDSIPLSMQISTVLWAVFVIAANLAVGTVRSIQAPRKFVPGQAQQRRATPTNRTSGLLVMLVLLGSLLLQVPVTVLSRAFGEPWLAAWIFGLFAGAAIVAYAVLLRNAELLILAHRDVLAEELCKV